MTDTPIPFPDLEALFLDAGNTIVTMRYQSLSRWLGELANDNHVSGLTPAEIARAEAAARPAVSRFVASGHSTEAGSTLEVYVRSIVEVTSAAESPAKEALIAGLIARLQHAECRDELWTGVPEGLPAALTALRRSGRKLIVVSNADGTVAEKLERVGLLDLCDAVVDSALVGFEKPDPRIFRHALDLAGCAAERCLHVGDLYDVDVIGARAAGVHAVLVDPHGDWAGYDCVRVKGVVELAERVLASV